MSMNNRVLILSMSMGLAATLLTACGPDRNTADTPPEGNAATNSPATHTASEAPKPEKLTIWANDAEKELAAMKKIVEKFTTETGVKVEVVPVNAREQAKTFSLDGPAGRGPDLWWATHNSMGKNVLQGLAEPYELSDDIISSYPAKTIKAVTQNGKIYNLPMVAETAILYYNKELLPEAPQKWTELESFAASYTDKKQDKYGFLIDGTNFYYTNMFMQGYGAYIFNYKEDTGYDSNDIGLNNEGAVKGAQLVQSWFKKGYLPQSITGDVMDGLFKEGKVGAVISVPSSLMNYKQALGEKLATAPIPMLDNGTRPPSFLGLKGWVLSPYSKNKEWATKLALYLTNDESLSYYFQNAGEVPAKTAMLDSDLVTKDPYFSAVGEQSKSATPTPNNPEISQTWAPMQSAFTFLSQGSDAKEVLDEAVSQLKEQIALNGAPSK
ncbi:extracellular solute-binding protein [Paenibacillus riograndensis]|nr:extracellular solute-binding protein [Paenibacillus riograndensis]